MPSIFTVCVLILLFVGAGLSLWFAFTAKPPDTDKFGNKIDPTTYWVGIAAIIALGIGFLVSLIVLLFTYQSIDGKIAKAVKEQKDKFEEVRKAYGVATGDLSQQVSSLSSQLQKNKPGSGFFGSKSSKPASPISSKDVGSAVAASPAPEASPAVQASPPVASPSVPSSDQISPIS